MRGLKWPENERFERFFSVIQQAAQEKHAVFFLFAGEGHTFTVADMEGEDLSGWLIPAKRASAFEDQWAQNNSLAALQEWTDYFVWAVWSFESGTLSVKFESL